MIIIPWHCHVCGSKFDTPDGGLCSRCNKATCRKCLLPGLDKKQSEGKKTSGYICRNCATPEELKKAAPLFKTIRIGSKQIKRASPILKKAAVAVFVLLVFGFLIDLFSGFYVLRHSKSIYAGLAALVVVAIFYTLGEGDSEWIGGKDDVTHPLHKRAFHLLLLLLFGGLVLVMMWFALKNLGLIRV
jgi:ABC-type branched-subunit amino acid transport system permease subunit